MRFIFLMLCGVFLSKGVAQRSIPPMQAVNSAYDEQNPVLSADGRTVYFTIANHPLNKGGAKDPGDIWYSTLGDDGGWSAPRHAGDALNDRGYNGVAGISADGKQLYLLSHYNGAGPARTQGIAVAQQAGDGWRRPENIQIPYFQNKSAMVSGCISADGKAFVYAAETYGSYGVEDIYVTVKGTDGKWSAPRNLGGAINTPFQELAPSLSEDGMTLYFSSNGRKGMGSFDVYAARRLDDSWTNWTAPENLGAEVNSEGRELYFRVYAAAGGALFTSTRNSDGYGDVKVHLSEDYRRDAPVQPVVVAENNPPVIETPPAIAGPLSVSGTVRDAKTGEPVAASLTFKPAEGTEISAVSSTDYQVSLPTTAAEYQVKIEAQGYISTMERLIIEPNRSAGVEMDFSLQPAEKGTTVNLRNVLFQQSTSTLLDNAYEELDMVVSFLKKNPNVSIELAGHTDGRGVHQDNVKLSFSRVQTVKEYLVSQGIDERRITGKGYGGSRPIASNDQEETRKLNRRVEFTIKKM